MNRITLLECLRDETLSATRDLIMPVATQKGDKGPESRAAEVYLTRSSAAKKKAPYVLHQVITGKDVQPSGQRATSEATIRTIFCVYNSDEQEGGLMLLNLMERLRIHLLKKGVIGKQFTLDLQAGMEALVYPEDTAPYYAGEMMSTWTLPAVEREVSPWL